MMKFRLFSCTLWCRVHQSRLGTTSSSYSSDIERDETASYFQRKSVRSFDITTKSDEETVSTFVIRTFSCVSSKRQSTAVPSNQEQSHSCRFSRVYREFYLVSRWIIDGTIETNVILANGLLSYVDHVC